MSVPTSQQQQQMLAQYAQQHQYQQQQQHQQQQQQPSLNKRPSETVLPQQPKPKKRLPPLPALLSIPESKMYADLVEMEQKLDWTITRKKVEVQDAVGRPVKVKRTIRVYLSNTSSFQTPPPPPAGESDVPGPEAGAIPSWALKIEGRLLDSGNPRLDKSSKRKFSTFLKSMVVELDRSDPSVQPGPNIIEWNKHTSSPAQDGFTIMRNGSNNIPIRIIMHLDHQPARYKVVGEFATVLDVKEETRVGILAALWSYIKINNLQDKDDRKKINADAKLRRIFGHDSLPIHYLPEVINRWIALPDPVVIRYTIRTDVERHVHPKVYDFEVEMDDPYKSRINTALQAFSEEGGKEIVGLDEEISNLAIALRNSRTKRDFLQSFASDPSAFIHKWLDSQARDLSLALGGEVNGVAGTGLAPEDLRRSEVFRLPWAEEATIISEGARAVEALQKGGR
ncbi:hypothetical protein BDY24DRAFT_404835 [Mrakia frigida]|uniref:uncharacterized protein n=1 Tax=Mrakia frigida TaxID=29902 RepID=UPI003FCBEF98